MDEFKLLLRVSQQGEELADPLEPEHGPPPVHAVDEADENGYVEDDYRIEYLRDHLTEMANAILKDGVDCLGYTMWGPVDLVSLSTGEMRKRYGFIYVDMDDKGNGTLKRSKKKSYDWMKHIIETNGAALDE